MKLVFMGTPHFAVPALQALCRAGHDVAAVFTQPDKPSGRKMKLIPTPVKQAATEQGITVYQPLSLRKGEDAAASLETLRKIAPDCIVVAAYGQILPKEILDLPKYGCVNIHASLLPKYRGAAPIQYAVLNGETESGVTVMQMAEGLDTGDMLLQRAVPITENETADELHDALAELGAQMICEAMEGLAAGTLTAVPQEDALSSYASRITKEMSALDFTRSASELHRVICALTGFTQMDGKRLKVYRAAVCPGKTDAQPGEITDPEHFTVACGGGTLLTFTEVQAEGSKRMQTDEFLRGRKLTRGQRLG